MVYVTRPFWRRGKQRAACRVLIAAAATTMLATGGIGLSTDPVAAAVADSSPRVFGSRESLHTDLSPFPKWTGVLERYFKDKAEVEGDCTETQFNRCHHKRWMALIDKARKKDPMSALNSVNAFMNRARYIVDPINWGVRDYWASPRQFFRKYGDCEDYAIAKYLTLRALGWEAERLRVVILFDLNLNVAHAILLVRHNGKYFALDNQISAVVDASRIRHYRPIYSVNETSWWRHRATVVP